MGRLIGMAQLTLRLDDELADGVRAHAEVLGRSVNSWVTALLRTALDPDFADSALERTRGRLARAGLLAPQPTRAGLVPPDPAALDAARRAAGQGTPLSKIVTDDRE